MLFLAFFKDPPPPSEMLARAACLFDLLDLRPDVFNVKGDPTCMTLQQQMAEPT